MAMIADRVNLLSLSTAYGLMNLAWPIGGILGPPIGGYLADVYGWTIFYLTLSIIALISFIISLFIIESKEKSETRGEKFTNGKKFTISVVFILIVFLSIHIMGNTARGILNTIFPFYLTDIFMKSKTEVGLFFSVGHGIATLITQYPSGFLADRIGRKKIMAYSVLFIPVLSILLIFTQNYIITLLIYMGITALWSATWPAAAAYLIEISSISKRGFMMGVRLTAVRLGFTIGPLIGGFLWDNFDIATSFYFVTAFFASSFIFILFLRE
jgi:DHA1 family multidrug resistance protein-like MFS transporter